MIGEQDYINNRPNTIVSRPSTNDNHLLSDEYGLE